MRHFVLHCSVQALLFYGSSAVFVSVYRGDLSGKSSDLKYVPRSGTTRGCLFPTLGCVCAIRRVSTAPLPTPVIHRALAIERAFKGVISAQLVLLPAAWQVVIMGVALRSEAG